jgi:hypothetical protein
MLPDTVKSQAAALTDALAAQGWSLVEIEQPFEDEWWAAEIWQIESLWSPHGVRAYLTFLVDPQGGQDDVWAVCASRHRPNQQTITCEPKLRLLNVWQQELPNFIRALSQFRADPKESRESSHPSKRRP